MTKEEIKYHVLKFLKSHSTLVLASISNDLEPEAATVYFVCDDDFNLYFMTPAKTKKADNLKTNGKVAFVIGCGPEIITVQGGGMAIELPKREMEIFYEIIKKVVLESVTQWPILQLAKGGYCMFKITPSWMSYLNLDKKNYPDIANKEYYKII